MATKTTAPSSLASIGSAVGNIASQVQKGGMTQSQIDSAKSQLSSLSSQLQSGVSSGAYKSGVDYAELDRPVEIARAAVITPEAMKPTAPLPVYKPTDLGAQGILTAMGQLGKTQPQQADITTADPYANFIKMQEALGQPPSTAEAYKQAQRETGIIEKQQKVNDLTAQLNQITSQAQANQLSVVGQGRGIPEAIIGGQQAQIAKEAAIQALPISASLQAAQGNLQMAEQNLNTLFQIKSQDATNQYNYKKELVKGLYDIADKAQQRELDRIEKLEDRKYNEQQKDIETIKQLSISAAKNGAGSTTISKIANSKTIGEALSASANYMESPAEKLQREKLALDIEKTRNDMKAITPDSPVQQKIDGAVSIKGLISDLQSMQGKSGAVGASFQKLVTWGKLIPGTAASNYKATFEQLRDTLAAENLSKLKGPMSDKDIVFVRNIATKLSTDLSETEFDKELGRLDAKMNEVLVRNGVQPSSVNTYSAMSNDQLLNMVSGGVNNQSFFSK